MKMLIMLNLVLVKRFSLFKLIESKIGIHEHFLSQLSFITLTLDKDHNVLSHKSLLDKTPLSSCLYPSFPLHL